MSTDLKQRISALSDEQRRLLANRLAGRTRSASATTTIPRRAPGAGRLPLSFAQQRLWFLDQVAPLNQAFAVTEMNRMTGPLNVAAFERSLNEIVRRHEVLRTTFTVIDGEPTQNVLPSLTIKVDVEDLSGLPEGDRPVIAGQRVAEAQLRPWALETGPLVRAHIWHLASDDHIVLVLLHHIVSDGWSKNILIKELAALFRAFSEGRPSPLPELAVQYGDFAVWEHEWVRGDEARAALDYWKRQMAGAPVLQLPVDGSRGAVESTRGFHRRMWIPAELKQSIKALSQRESATPFMVLFAAFAMLLSRYSGQDDIVMGSSFANRRVREVEDLIGCFMNPLPLRVSLSGNPTFRELLGRVREAALGAYAHQGAPFDLLVRTLQQRRDPGVAPLFQALFLLQNFDWQELDLSGSELGRRSIVVSDAELSDEPYPGDLAYPVTLEIVQFGDRLLATFEYSPDFARVFAQVPSHFRAVLDAVLANPDVRIGSVSILTEGERQRLLEASNGSGAARYRIRPVHRLFEEQVERTPDAVAVVSNGDRVTYAELNARANRLAHYLIARGIGAECPVGIVLDRSVDAVVAVLAVLKAGGAYVPLDPNYPSERQAFVLGDASVRAIVTTQRLLDRAPGMFGAVAGSPVRICLDASADAIAAESVRNTAPEPSVDNLAYVIYTSGSTGTPKGTMISHASLANAFFAWRDAYRLHDAGTSHLQMASISFDVFSGDLVRALCSGGKLVLVPQEHLFSPADLYRLMRDERVDCAEFVPAVIRDLAKYVEETGGSLDFLKLLIVGSDSWLAGEYAALGRLAGASTRVINSYGVSEATIDSSYLEGVLLDASADTPLPIGRSFTNTGLYVLDGQFQLAPTGVPGELCIGGPGLARGYLNRPDLTAEKFIPHPFPGEPGERLYRTGDLARFLPDGNLELLGRIDHQVKLRGFRIEVGEIEAVLARQPGVEHAVVVLREDVPGDKRLVAYVIAADVNAPELRRLVREKLPEYMVPSAIVSLAAFPLLPNGKVDRRGLPAPEGQRQTEAAFVAPTNETERAIADVWKELLRVEKVGIHDNFFDLGGHSLLVIQLHSRLRKTLDRDLAVLDLFIHPTIHALATKLGGPGGTPAPDVATFDDVRDRAAKQREAMKRRRLGSEPKEVAR